MPNPVDVYTTITIEQPNGPRRGHMIIANDGEANFPLGNLGGYASSDAALTWLEDEGLDGNLV